MKLIEIHTAIFNQLNSNVSVRIYDYLPTQASTKPPFIILGRLRFDNPVGMQTKTTGLDQVIQNILVVTEAREKLKASRIVAEIQDAFQDNINLQNSIVLDQRLQEGSIEELEDGTFVAEIQLLLWIQNLD